jgi:hypothetical protein
MIPRMSVLNMTSAYKEAIMNTLLLTLVSLGWVMSSQDDKEIVLSPLETMDTVAAFHKVATAVGAEITANGLGFCFHTEGGFVSLGITNRRLEAKINKS